MVTVQIYGSVAGKAGAPEFLNEVIFKNVLDAMAYADQLAKEDSAKTYVVYDYEQRKIQYQR